MGGTTQVVGIDLGTTNSVVAWTGERGAVRVHDVPQLVAAGEVTRRSTLPSFLYFPDDLQRSSGAVRLPWDAAPDVVVGAYARDEGALVPARQIASAKSWLSNAHVDRTAALLPWGTDVGPKLSPVDASARVLAHMRDAWNHEHALADDALRLERQHIVLAVPASFDEEARELTVAAARGARFEHLTLLEEPLAALYAWIAAHRRQLGDALGHGALVLVCDVGGGTTDFSLIRTSIGDGDLAFERIAIGEHLLLGGDNLDLALAALVEQQLGSAAQLSLTQRLTLRRRCSAAKEALLSNASIDQVAITILGSGRGVVAGGMTATLTRDDVVRALTEGFLPIGAVDDVPARDRRVGLRELGLPFETEPAVTKHLAAFLARAARSAPVDTDTRPTAVLFNGGFFTPALARDRVLDALAAWFGQRPTVLENARPEAAVAIGAAFYGRLRRNPAASRRLLIRAGSARSYYIAVATDVGSESPDKTPAPASTDAARHRESEREHETVAVCIMPRGTQEGTTIELDRELTVVTNQPAAFTLYSSAERTDPPNTLVTLLSGDEVVRHAPLVTAFRYGKRSRRQALGVRLTALFTETGTLELWCESRTTDHRWRLAFNLRGFDPDPLDDTVGESDETATAEVLISNESLQRAGALIRDVFGPGQPGLAPDLLVGELENVMGHGKAAWPLGAIRTLADVLLDTEPGRSKSAACEARWLNLTGFCTRPGFGSTLDVWRVSELRKLYAAGLTFPKEIQNQVEWIVLWQRVGAGFSAGQQRELALRVSGQLGLGQRKAPRLNAQIERESWRLLASLERLDTGQRAKLGDELLDRIRREPRTASWLWGIGRLGARHPLYGPLNSVVPPSVAERWVERLVALKEITPDTASAIAQIGARTGDGARDLSESAARAAADRLEASGFPPAAEQLQSVIAPDRVDVGRVFGEALPEGLRLG